MTISIRNDEKTHLISSPFSVPISTSTTTTTQTTTPPTNHNPSVRVHKYTCSGPALKASALHLEHAYVRTIHKHRPIPAPPTPSPWFPSLSPPPRGPFLTSPPSHFSVFLSVLRTSPHRARVYFTTPFPAELNRVQKPPIRITNNLC